MADAGNSPHLVFDTETQIPLGIAKRKTAHISVVATGKDEARWVRTTRLVNDAYLEALRDLQHGEFLAVLVVANVFKLPTQVIFDCFPSWNSSFELAAYEPTGVRF